ncbi:MAG: 3-carboxy-cis,cis-muconate cycloisomerase [Catenulispora sp.]|nr:3-carboxy-cis,cis-muconate cycloisomerase [Catenulispora sp.]
MIEVEVALSRAQGTRAVPAVLPDAAALAPEARSGGNPVLPLLEALDDPHLHQGPTSQDILDTALMITARRALTFTLLDVDAAIAATTRLAAEHRDTPMVARTLTQQAVPTTFGLKAAGWRHLLITARRALAATAQALPVQLGGAGGTLASFVAMAEAERGSGAADQDLPSTDSMASHGEPAALAAGHDHSPAAAGPIAQPNLPTTDTLPTGPDRAPAAASPIAQPNLPTTDTLPTATPHRFADTPSDTLPTAGAVPEPPSAASEQLAEPPLDPAVAASLTLVARVAANLDLAIPLLPWHVLRTPIADLASSLALASGALGKVAADVLVLSRTEIGEVSEGVGGVSSTMPHKANPVRATLIASAARQVPALTSILFASVSAEDERPAGAWHAEWQPLREALRLVGGAAATAAELLGALRVHPERMAANLAQLDLAEARRFAGREVSDPCDYLGAASALVDRALKETP